METQTQNPSKSACESCNHDCHHCHGCWGKSSLFRIMLLTVLALLIFLFGLTVGRLSAFEQDTYGARKMMMLRNGSGDMLYWNGDMPMMRVWQTSATAPTATSTSKSTKTAK